VGGTLLTARGPNPCSLLIEIAVVANRRRHSPVHYFRAMLFDGLHMAPMSISGRSLRHPHAPLSSVKASSFRSRLGPTQSIASRKVSQEPDWSIALRGVPYRSLVDREQKGNFAEGIVSIIGSTGDP
jgi:hypothetical protein